MPQPYIGEIRLVGFNFAPQNWAFCNGQVMAIDQNDALFSLIGTTYGGDGQQTFALPNLQSRVPIHMGGAFTQGESGGSETVTLIANQLPVHTHIAVSNEGGNVVSPANAYWSTDSAGGTAAYTSAAGDSTMAADAIMNAGGSQPHDNMQPYTAINYIIALVGVYPPRN